MHKKKSNFKQVYKNNKFILSYAFKAAPAYVISAVGLRAWWMVMQFFEFTYMMKVVVDCIQYHRPFSEAAHYIIFVAIYTSITLCIDAFSNNFLLVKGQAKIYRKLRLDIFEKVSKMDLECYDNPEFYTDFVWSMSEAGKRTDAVLKTVSNLFESVALILTAGVFVIVSDYYGLIFVAICFALTFFSNSKLNKRQVELDTEKMPIQRKRDYISRVFYLADFAKEIRLHNIGDMLLKRFKKSNDELIEKIDSKTKKMVVFQFLSNFVFNTIILNGLYTAFVLLRMTVYKTISYGTGMAMFQAVWRLKNGLNLFTTVFPEFTQHSMYIEKMKKILTYESAVTNTEKPLPMPSNNADLELKNVSFGYSKDTMILKNINMTIGANQKIAIVGYNGAGKTTLIKLLMRLYDVSSGEIRFNNANINNYDVEQYRDSFGAVFQDYQLFASNIADNVAMGLDNENSADIENALTKSGFANKLDSLPDGINTNLTREFEDNGVDLSGGEAQKIAIARVLYKQSNIIILDEPSSALDPISEYHLNQTITEAARDKTIIFISHRLSTTRIADIIYMLENGEIVEHGSHDELMSQNGKYAYMFNLQAEKYKIEQAAAVSL